MKVTVCFDNVRVIVPCGDGDLLVKELIEKAIIRYKKAVGKSNNSWVTVQSLKTCSDGGILDPDDHLNDVVDDREQLTAIYEEQPANHLHNNGDGASASSVGTSSPDIFQSNNGPTSGASNGEFKSSTLSDNDVIVTLEDVPSGPGLTVRRGSEPALVGLGEDETSSGLSVKPETPIVHKRWATFGNDTEFNTSTPKKENGDSDFLDAKKRLQPRWSSTGHNKLLAPKFFRDPCRQSLGNRPDMFKWFDAQERQEERFKDTQDGREEPVGGSIEKETNSNVAEKELEIIVTLKNDGEPLGIHVVPDYDEDDKETGLLLQRIEPGSKVSRDGRLKTDDRIIEINGSNLMGISFDRAQEIFRKAMKTDEIQLKVLKSNPPPLPKLPPPILPKPTIRNRTSPNKPSPLTLPPSNPEESKDSDQTDNSKNGNYDDISSSTSSGKSESNAASDEKPSSASSLTENSGSIEDDSVPPSPTKKVPPAVPARHPNTTLSTKERGVFSASTNTRKIGKKHAIQLKKGSNGLGFSITSRDNPTGGTVPIYIKNILPKGAAVEDGRLKPGDRLLEVNGIEMSDKTQGEAVTILRNTQPGSIVDLLVSRQSADEPPPKPARENLDRKTSSRPSSTSPAMLVDHGGTSPTPDISNQEYLTFDIALNETCSAGLGVSVKGNTNPCETGANRDLGIFVKAIINGGAASKDGRLKVNDQLIEINGDSLLGLTNQDAMETLRQAMRSIDTVNSHIRLVIARHSEYSASPLLSINSANNSNHNSSFSDETDSIENGQNNGNVVNNKFFNCQTRNDSSKNLENLQNANLDENGNNSDVIMVPNNERTKPVVPHIERLRGGHGGGCLNNDSYNRAVHSSFEDSSVHIDSRNASPIPERKNSNSSTESKYSLAKSYQNQGIRSLTVNPPEQETVLIEEDSYEQDDGYPPVFSGDNHQSSSSHQKQELEHYYRREELPPRKPEQQSRPSHPNHPPPLPPHPQHHPSQAYSSNPPPNFWNEETMENHENSQLSPLSPDFDPTLAFQREGFGRQSMSEKRRGHGDARNSDFYHLAKNNRDDRAGKQGLVRAGSMESLIGNKVSSGTKLHDDMSHRGMHSDMSLRKRSSSMESLPTPDTAFENHAPPFWVADRAARGRMCNESFRAAVDRSYNAPQMSGNMETLEEENSDSASNLGHGQLPPHVHRPVPHKENAIPQEIQGPPPPPQTVTKATKKKEKERDNRKSGGIFKGIFKFGKSNKEDKAVDKKDQAAEKENSGKQKNDKPLPEVLEMDRNWKNPRADQERLPDHPKSPYLAPRTPAPRQRPGYRDPHYAEPYAQPAPSTRTDKIQQLREEHQRRHQERQGRYPLDEQEEMYERHLQELERRKFNNQNQHPPQQPPYPEAEYAIVNKIRHPGGRPNPHERMNVHPNYQEKSHAPPYVPPYTPQPNGDERFYPPDYPSESQHPKHPPPYPAGSREGWHNNGYRGQPPRPQPRHHRDNPHYHHPQDNSPSSHEPWIYIRPGGHSAPPSWPHSIQIESPAATGDMYDYHSNGRYDYADPTYAVIPSGRRTPNSSANV